MNDLELDGWKLIVKWANNKTTIHVGNINFKTTEEDLKNFFSDCGDIKSISIAKNKEGKSCDFAYIFITNFVTFINYFVIKIIFFIFIS